MPPTALLLVCVLLLTAGIVLADPVISAAPQPPARFRDLGVQITSATAQGTTFAKDPSGRDVVYTVMRGDPAKLAGFDVRTGERLAVVPLPGANGAWNATTASDGTVYVGTDSNGHLYRYRPGDAAASDLGLVLPGQSFVWDVAAGADGAVFGGTYPGGQVFRYHPDTGFADVAGGAVVPGEDYVRGVAVDPATGTIYAGVGAHAQLVEIDPATGTKADLLPKDHAHRHFVYAVDVIDGRIFGQLSGAGPGEMIIINAKTREVEATLPFGSGAQQVVSPKSPYDDRVYYSVDGKLHAYDLAARRAERVLPEVNFAAQAMAWIRFDEPDFPGPTLVGLARGGEIVRYHPKTLKTSRVKVKLPREPVPIQSIVRGPDGRIYSGGYLSGGISAYDPETDASSTVGSLSQSEGITVVGSRIYFGVYPGARLYVYDTTKPWNARRDNPKLIGELKSKYEQDRPFGMLGVADLGKVFVGTVPDYGVLGGALASIDVKTNALDVHRNVVPQQSVVALAYTGGLVWGGTSIAGGLGIEPPADAEAKLFAWDPAGAKVVFETTPVPGATAITSLTVGPDGNLWGWANGTLFVMKPDTRKVVFVKEFYPTGRGQGRVPWRMAAMELHPDGQFYGTIRGQLFRLDPAQKQMTILRDTGAGLIAFDDAGRVYFRDGANLWQYAP